MPPKRTGKKRKVTTSTDSTDDINGHVPLLPPDCATWPGWVEMESEPAFFNVMLKEMGVRGVKVQEVYGLDDEMLAILPQPLHALIFLFRYKDEDQAQQEKGTSCPEHVWFANQIPDFACATVALLNIVNNIHGLDMGKELRDFRDFTQNMDPVSCGDAIDGFDFVKHIHNSFARETDLLNADMLMKQKAAKAKKKQALAKARDTKEAKKAGKTPLKEKSVNASAVPTRTSERTPKKTAKTFGPGSTDSSPLSDPPNSDVDFPDTPSKTEKPTAQEHDAPRRRSERKPKPQQDTFAASAAASATEAGTDNEEGFHFIAYMPIEDHVWKLDGLDRFPHDMGTFDAAAGGHWMNIAQPALQTRMAMYEGADIEFNLMAVVHDPIMRDRRELMMNVKELQAVEQKRDKLSEGWRTLDEADTKEDVLLGTSVDLDISQAEIDAIELSTVIQQSIENEIDLIKLLELREQVINKQKPLRAAVRDALQSGKGDDEKARHRRHDYGSFVRSWLVALAEQELLTDLLE